MVAHTLQIVRSFLASSELEQIFNLISLECPIGTDGHGITNGFVV